MTVISTQPPTIDPNITLDLGNLLLTCTKEFKDEKKE